MGLLTKIFGTYSDRELKQIYPIVDQIEALEPQYKAMSDAQLAAAGIPAGLIRMSCGLESREDLIEDIRQALEAAV